FGKHLEEEHVTWAQFEKKLNKNATFQAPDFHSDIFTKSSHKVLFLIKVVTYEVVETASEFTIDAVKIEEQRCHHASQIADKEKPIEVSTGGGLMSGNPSLIFHILGGKRRGIVTQEKKKQLWLDLKAVIDSANVLSLVMGDFNVVRSQSERVGSNFCHRNASAFNEFISSSSLFYLPMGGYQIQAQAQEPKRID
ncbi:cytochrome P450, partial [Tanacetum coccineum]